MARRKNNSSNPFVSKGGPKIAPDDERKIEELEEAEEKQAKSKEFPAADRARPSLRATQQTSR